jgi:DNA-binding transcriptional LysR family regulator
MDVELARTFLTIVRTRSFVRAAEDLNVSQTTVSARIRSLEEQLRRPLFLRGRHGVSLTPAGEQFLRYAPDIVQLWQRARQQVTVPRGRRALLTIGTELGLWQPWLVEWLRFMRRTVPDVALRARIHPAEELVDAVAAGTLDLAVAYAPRHLPGVRIELLMEERLILVTTASDGAVDPDSYVQVDWGHDFAARFDPGLPAGVDPGLSIDLGPLALAYLLEAGGSGYFRQRAAAPHIASGRLHPVPGAPSFSYPVYAVRPAGTSDELVEHALAGLRHTTDADGTSLSDIQPDGILR